MNEERLLVLQAGVVDPKPAYEKKRERRQDSEDLRPAGSVHLFRLHRQLVSIASSEPGAFQAVGFERAF